MAILTEAFRELSHPQHKNFFEIRHNCFHSPLSISEFLVIPSIFACNLCAW